MQMLPVMPLFPYTTLFRSADLRTTGQTLRAECRDRGADVDRSLNTVGGDHAWGGDHLGPVSGFLRRERSEEHTSELQSLRHLVCRLLLDNKKVRAYNLGCY